MIKNVTLFTLVALCTATALGMDLNNNNNNRTSLLSQTLIEDLYQGIIPQELKNMTHMQLLELFDKINNEHIHSNVQNTFNSYLRGLPVIKKIILFEALLKNFNKLNSFYNLILKDDAQIINVIDRAATSDKYTIEQLNNLILLFEKSSPLHAHINLAIKKQLEKEESTIGEHNNLPLSSTAATQQEQQVTITFECKDGILPIKTSQSIFEQSITLKNLFNDCGSGTVTTFVPGTKAHIFQVFALLNQLHNGQIEQVKKTLATKDITTLLAYLTLFDFLEIKENHTTFLQDICLEKLNDPKNNETIKNELQKSDSIFKSLPQSVEYLLKKNINLNFKHIFFGINIPLAKENNYNIAIDPKRSLIIVLHKQESLKFYTYNGQEVKSNINDLAPTYSCREYKPIRLSPDGKHIILLFAHNLILLDITNLSDVKKIYEFDVRKEPYATKKIGDVAFLDNDSLLLTESYTKGVDDFFVGTKFGLKALEEQPPIQKAYCYTISTSKQEVVMKTTERYNNIIPNNNNQAYLINDDNKGFLFDKNPKFVNFRVVSYCSCFLTNNQFATIGYTKNDNNDNEETYLIVYSTLDPQKPTVINLSTLKPDMQSIEEIKSFGSILFMQDNKNTLHMWNIANLEKPQYITAVSENVSSFNVFDNLLMIMKNGTLKCYLIDQQNTPYIFDGSELLNLEQLLFLTCNFSKEEILNNKQLNEIYNTLQAILPEFANSSSNNQNGKQEE